MKLLLATSNKGKVKDLKAMLVGRDIEVLSLDDFENIEDVIEDGETFLDNALKKARSYYKQTGVATLADDSGLEVFSLNGEPGVHSARYGGEPSSDEKNVAKLLKNLDGKKEDQRAARFVCVLVYIDDNKEEHVTEGECPGIIAESAKGDNGFGYDPLFIHDEFSPKTLAEVSRDDKNSVSHRGIAFRKMTEIFLSDIK